MPTYDPLGQALARDRLGFALVAQVPREDWSEAITLFRRALELVETPGATIDLDTGSEVDCRFGFYYLVTDVQIDQARRHLTRSLELRREMADPYASHGECRTAAALKCSPHRSCASKGVTRQLRRDGTDPPA